MKQVEHKTEQGVILFVDVPDEANSFTIEHGRLCFNDNENMPDYRCLNKYGFTPEKGQDDDDFWELASKHQEEQNRIDKFVLIGLTSDVTEDKAQNMFKGISTAQLDGEWFSIGDGDGFRYETALSAFKSLMQHKKLYEVNPLGQEPFDRNTHYHNSKIMQNISDRWLEAQERTSKRVVLFKPNEK